MVEHQVLKLDSSFKPLGIISWQEALCLTYMNKAWIAQTYDSWVHSAKEAFKVPSVVVLYKYIKEEHLTIQCTRANVFKRDSYRCQYCFKSSKEANLTLDHVIPKSRGGLFEWTNIVSACVGCNQRKGCQLLHEIDMKLLRTPRRPTYREILKYKISRITNDWSNYL